MQQTRRRGPPGFFDGTPRWTWQVLGGLAALHLVQLLWGYFGVQPSLWGLAYQAPWDAPWRLITRWLAPGMPVGSAVLGLLTLLFFLPPLVSRLGPRDLLAALGSSLVGATGLGVLAPWVHLTHPGPLAGWSCLLFGLTGLFGLCFPTRTIHLFGVLPLTGTWLSTGSIVVAVLLCLESPTPTAAEAIGAWLGAYAWYRLMGPGRSQTKAPAKPQPTFARNFQVLEGGKGRPADPDELVH